MSKTKNFLAVVGALSVFPFAALAQQTTVGGILANLSGTFGTIISLLFVIATVIFLWGITSYIAKGDDDAAKKKAKSLITWGIIGMAVMASAWGISKILTGYFGVGGDQVIPSYQGNTVNTPSGGGGSNSGSNSGSGVAITCPKINGVQYIPNPTPSDGRGDCIK